MKSVKKKYCISALKDAPQNVSGYNKSSTSIHLIWLPIPHQPNILYYKINVNHLGSSAVSFVFTIIGLELDIQGLQKYTDYQISVCGVNTVGDGPYSVPVIISTDMEGMYCAWIKFLNTDIEPFVFWYNSKKKFTGWEKIRTKRAFFRCKLTWLLVCVLYKNAL